MCGLGGLGGRCRVWGTTVVKARQWKSVRIFEGLFAYNFDSAVP